MLQSEAHVSTASLPRTGFLSSWGLHSPQKLREPVSDPCELSILLDPCELSILLRRLRQCHVRAPCTEIPEILVNETCKFGPSLTCSSLLHQQLDSNSKFFRVRIQGFTLKLLEGPTVDLLQCILLDSSNPHPQTCILLSSILQSGADAHKMCMSCSKFIPTADKSICCLLSSFLELVA